MLSVLTLASKSTRTVLPTPAPAPARFAASPLPPEELLAEAAAPIARASTDAVNRASISVSPWHGHFGTADVGLDLMTAVVADRVFGDRRTDVAGPGYATGSSHRCG